MIHTHCQSTDNREIPHHLKLGEETTTLYSAQVREMAHFRISGELTEEISNFHKIICTNLDAISVKKTQQNKQKKPLTFNVVSQEVVK